MTTDPTLDVLDERGRAAGAAVRAAVADRPVPELDPDLVRVHLDDADDPASGRRRRVGAVVGVAAAVVLLLGAAVVVLTGRGEPDSTPADRVGTGDMGRYVLGDLPEGFAPGAVLDATAASGEDDPRSRSVTVYGRDEVPVVGLFALPSDDDARGADDVVVTCDADGTDCETVEGDEAVGADDVPDVAEGLDPVDVGARRAWDASPLIGDGALIVDAEGTPVLVLGASLGLDGLAALAGEVIVDGDAATLPDPGAIGGWQQLGTVPAAATSRWPWFDESQRRGVWSVLYARGPLVVGPEVLVGVTTSVGDGLAVQAPRLVAADVTDVVVRGHEGVLVRSPADADRPEEWGVRWEERPGVIVDLSVSGEAFGRDEVLALAEGVRPADEGEAAALAREALRAEAGLPGVTLLGEGDFSDGSPWALVAVEDGGGQAGIDLRTSLAGTSSTGSASSGSSAGAGPPAFVGGFSEGDAGDVAWLYGQVRADVATVELRDALTEDVLATTDVLVSERLRGWVLEVSGRGRDHELVALDAGGSELARLSIGR